MAANPSRRRRGKRAAPPRRRRRRNPANPAPRRRRRRRRNPGLNPWIKGLIGVTAGTATAVGGSYALGYTKLSEYQKAAILGGGGVVVGGGLMFLDPTIGACVATGCSAVALQKALWAYLMSSKLMQEEGTPEAAAMSGTVAQPAAEGLPDVPPIKGIDQMNGLDGLRALPAGDPGLEVIGTILADLDPEDEETIGAILANLASD